MAFSIRKSTHIKDKDKDKDKDSDPLEYQETTITPPKSGGHYIRKSTNSEHDRY